MAKEYIDREKLLHGMCAVNCGCTDEPCANPVRCFAGDYIERFPAADVAPVVHGRWENGKRSHYPECTVCGYMPQYDPHIDDIYYSQYCPNCGAKMDSEVLYVTKSGQSVF